MLVNIFALNFCAGPGIRTNFLFFEPYFIDKRKQGSYWGAKPNNWQLLIDNHLGIVGDKLCNKLPCNWWSSNSFWPPYCLHLSQFVASLAKTCLFGVPQFLPEASFCRISASCTSRPLSCTDTSPSCQWSVHLQDCRILEQQVWPAASTWWNFCQNCLGSICIGRLALGLHFETLTVFSSRKKKTQLEV